ncbi:hypothetical protein [Paenibacillus sp. DMB20]|nr:hypothetical protein [Paenibacillus sp. DMB20]
MNDKQLLSRKIIVYSLLSALVILAGSRARDLQGAGEVQSAGNGQNC